MTKSTLRQKPSLPSSTSGLSLVEVLIALAIGMLIVSLAMGLTLSNRKLLDQDQARTSVNQNLRSVIDIIGDDVRVTGQRLGEKPILSPIEIQNNTLTLRRNLSDVVMTLCEHRLRENESIIKISRRTDETTHVGCAFNQSKQNTWKNFREDREDNGESITYAYIHMPNLADPSDDHGEFFIYESEDNHEGQLRIKRDSSPWQYDYDTHVNGTGDWRDPNTNIDSQPTLYLLEERVYTLRDGVIYLRINGQAELGVVDNIEAMTVTATLNNGTTVSQINSAKTWENIRSVNLSITGQTVVNGKSVERTVTSELFPRNVLSR